MQILVVDDSRIMRNIIKNIINSVNSIECEFFEAIDGLMALDVLGNENIDLLLLDWNMPRLNGLQLIKKLRADINYKDLPVIMVTSEAAKYNVIEAVKAGATDYMIKPVSEKILIEKIKKYNN